jgi:hypothetical protein
MQPGAGTMDSFSGSEPEHRHLWRGARSGL